MIAHGSEDEIRQLLNTYEHSLNTSDASLAARCYTRDGLFMPTTMPTARASGLEAAYAQIFQTIRLAVHFTIDELVVGSSCFAHALTRSNGTQTHLDSGAQRTEANREMFIFAPEAGAWKISRYMFNKAE